MITQSQNSCSGPSIKYVFSEGGEAGQVKAYTLYKIAVFPKNVPKLVMM